MLLSLESTSNRMTRLGKASSPTPSSSRSRRFGRSSREADESPRRGELVAPEAFRPPDRAARRVPRGDWHVDPALAEE